jgi:glucose-1-phosphate thymidylyltransferase
MRFSYAAQPRPEGLAQAFVIGRDFVGSDPVALVLGDNIFYGQGFQRLLHQASTQTRGATIFGYQVRDPNRYGVVEFDANGRVISLEEKPKQPKSNYAVPGLYFYDNQVIEITANLKSSPRGELEITDVNRVYLEKGQLNVLPFSRGFAWFDAGTHESLLESGQFVAAVEKRQGLKISCPEEIAYRKGFITAQQLEVLSQQLGGDYVTYLQALLP